MTLSAPTIDFNPRPPWGGRQEQRDNYKAQADISIHALRGEGDSGLRSMTRGRMISIHALRGEGDDKLRVDQTVARKFQSTPSVGRATVKLSPPVKRSLRFQSTPSVGRATPARGLRQSQKGGFQSTPSVGRATFYRTDNIFASLDFNPRPPWGGRPPRAGRRKGGRGNFNPRPPWGGRPEHSGKNFCFLHHFNPRPPWGGRQDEESGCQDLRHFNPRPPWGGRRRLCQRHGTVRRISIHALRGEGDVRRRN